MILNSILTSLSIFPNNTFLKPFKYLHLKNTYLTLKFGLTNFLTFINANLLVLISRKSTTTLNIKLHTNFLILVRLFFLKNLLLLALTHYVKDHLCALKPHFIIFTPAQLKTVLLFPRIQNSLNIMLKIYLNFSSKNHSNTFLLLQPLIQHLKL